MRLLEVDVETTTHSFLLYAKIRVKGSRGQFFNSSFDFCLNGNVYKLMARNAIKDNCCFSRTSGVKGFLKTLEFLHGGGDFLFRGTDGFGFGKNKIWFPKKVNVKPL